MFAHFVIQLLRGYNVECPTYTQAKEESYMSEEYLTVESDNEVCCNEQVCTVHVYMYVCIQHQMFRQAWDALNNSNQAVQ